MNNAVYDLVSFNASSSVSVASSVIIPLSDGVTSLNTNESTMESF